MVWGDEVTSGQVHVQRSRGFQHKFALSRFGGETPPRQPAGTPAFHPHCVNETLLKFAAYD
jgi:hypothetical protein